MTVPGLNGVAHTLAHMRLGWIAFGAVVSLGGAGGFAVGAWLLIDRAVPAAVGIAVLAFFLALPRLSEFGATHRAPGRIQRLLKRR